MWRLSFYGRGVFCLALALGFVAWTRADSPNAAPAAAEILERLARQTGTAVTNLASRELTYRKIEVVERVNGSGEVKGREEKLYDVLFRGGKVRMTLVQSKGETITDEDDEVSEEKPGKASKGSAMKPPRKEERPMHLSEELLGHFDFRVVSQETVRGRACYLLEFKPRPGLKASGLVERFLARLEGRIWVDLEEFDVAQARVRLGSPLTIWGGLVGALSHFEYHLERERLQPGFWYNRTSRSQFELRRLMVSTRYRTESEWKSVQVR